VILWRRVEQGNPSGRIAKIYIGTERLTQSGILQPLCVSFYFLGFYAISVPSNLDHLYFRI
jgi:hypothetical protein